LTSTVGFNCGIQKLGYSFAFSPATFEISSSFNRLTLDRSLSSILRLLVLDPEGVAPAEVVGQSPSTSRLIPGCAGVPSTSLNFFSFSSSSRCFSLSASSSSFLHCFSHSFNFRAFSFFCSK
uniref:Secreted protein n=1 Tax=Brugia timori TaxID=42155 RepID=A0A0R3QFR5_9BILA